MSDRVVLAYSGGLETALCVHWLKFHRGLRVVTFSANLGYGSDFESLGEHAVEAGAETAHVGDLRERFLREYCFPALRAGARYEDHYLLSAALSRPLIVSELVRLALEDGCGSVAHGCTPKGNDQLRFEAAIARLAPSLSILAPLRLWGYRSREEMMREAQTLGLRYLKRADDEFSVDRNIWGAVIETRRVLDLDQPLPASLFTLTRPAEKAPAKAADLTLRFEKAVPTALDGVEYGPIELVERLNAIGGLHGVGRVDTIEDRINGTKTRKLYETPGATILYHGLRGLEEVALSRDVRMFQGLLSTRYAELVHSGQWWSDLREALDAFFERLARYVCGTVRLRLYKGGVQVLERESPFSQYSPARFRRGIDPFFAADVDSGDLLGSVRRQGASEARRDDVVAPDEPAGTHEPEA